MLLPKLEEDEEGDGGRDYKQAANLMMMIMVMMMISMMVLLKMVMMMMIMLMMVLMMTVMMTMRRIHMIFFYRSYQDWDYILSGVENYLPRV